MTLDIIALSLGIGLNVGVLYLIKKVYDEYAYHMERIHERERLRNVTDDWVVISN